MLLTKFQDNRTFVLEEKILEKKLNIYEHGGHLGHVTRAIVLRCIFLLPKAASHKVWL